MCGGISHTSTHGTSQTSLAGFRTLEQSRHPPLNLIVWGSTAIHVASGLRILEDLPEPWKLLEPVSIASCSIYAFLCPLITSKFCAIGLGNLLFWSGQRVSFVDSFDRRFAMKYANRILSDQADIGIDVTIEVPT